MKTPVSLTIDAHLYDQLNRHLFPGDDDEHGAVLSAGIVETARGTRLLAREVFVACDGVDYLPSTRGYRALSAEFVARVSDYCSREQLCYLAIHCHGGRDTVGFSADDLTSHARGYPALLDITEGGPVGALVFAEDAVAGEIWTPLGIQQLSHVTIVGSRVRRLYPSPQGQPPLADAMYDRQARLFGDAGQAMLARLKVGIIGAGGGGSLINEWLARLGVGHIAAIDFDYTDLTNVPRIAGATKRDAMSLLTDPRRPAMLRSLGRRLARRKVRVARRVARQANPAIHYDAIVGNILDRTAASHLRDADFIFLATDTVQSRLVFNALVHQYLIPGAQIGINISVNAKTGRIGDITTRTRIVLPAAFGGCLMCHELLSPQRLQEEALSPSERAAQRYVDHQDVTQPSVITLNALSAAQAANDFMMMFTGLYPDHLDLPHLIGMVNERTIYQTSPVAQDHCLECSTSSRSRRARGDRRRLPCRPE